MTNTVKEITCPECDRIWPTIAEQGIVCELYGKCYQCFIDQVIKARDERAETADYIVQNCSSCGGLSPKVKTCTLCASKGWETVPKGKDIQIAYPHAYPH